MPEYKIIMPSKPRVVLDEGNKGVFEIDGLYPGYGHTLGNSLRRIILSSLPGASVTSIKIDGISHEFSTMEGIKEDVIVMILNIKKLRFKISSDEPQTVTIAVKGPKVVTGADVKTSGQVEILNGDQYITEVTGKVNLNVEMKIEKGLGFIPKEILQKEKVDIGTIAVDAIFTPIRRVSYEVENMRVGDKTNHNRLRISIETDGTLTAREALTRSIEIMINQLKAIVDFKEEEVVIKDVPMNKWFNVIIKCQNKDLIVYVNGMVANSIKLHNVPKQNYGSIYMSNNGGFSGNTSNLWYYSYALSSIEIQNLVKNGPNTSIVSGSTINQKNADYLSLRWYFNR